MRSRTTAAALAVLVVALAGWYLRAKLVLQGLGNVQWSFAEVGVLLVLFAAVLWVARSLVHDPLPARGAWVTLLGTGGSVAFSLLLVAGFLVYLRTEGYTLPAGESTKMLVFAGTWGAATGALAAVNWARANRSLARAVERRDEFALLNTVLRHNVLNGINVIQGTASLLAEEADEAERDRLAVIEQRSEEIAALVEQVRTLTELRGENDGRTPVDLASVLEDAVASAATTFPDAEFAADVPDEARAYGTPLLRAAFDNLLTNAVEHNDAATPRVTVSLSESAGAVTVAIADNGPGIADGGKRELFEKESYSDTFGLYLVDVIVTEVGGEVRVENTEPRGAVFRCEFERVDATDE